VIPIQQHYGWRASFFVLGLIGVGWVAAWRRLYHDHPSDSARISQSELDEIGRTTGNSEQTLPWRSALRSRNLWAILLSGFSYRYGIYFFQFWLPTYLVSGRGYSETALLLTTWLFAGGAVANVTGGWASDALVKRLGLKAARRTVPFAGLVVSALSLTLTIFVAGKYYLLVLLALGYCGITFAQAPCWAVCMDVGARFTGVVSGARNTCPSPHPIRAIAHVTHTNTRWIGPAIVPSRIEAKLNQTAAGTAWQVATDGFNLLVPIVVSAPSFSSLSSETCSLAIFFTSSTGICSKCVLDFCIAITPF
jgi:MFS family permease